MNVEGCKVTLSNLDIAERQLERSIELFLDRKDFVSALTLAGAAEEILGKLLKAQDKKHWLEEITGAALKALGYRKSDMETPSANQARKGIVALANRSRNSLKHYNDDGSITLEIDVEAADMIDRAVSNYWKLTQRETGAMGRFRELVFMGDEA